MSAHEQPTSRADGASRPKDFWDILGVISQFTLGVAAVLITVFLHLDAGRRQRSDTVLSVVNERERSEMTFRSSMFSPLLDRMLNSQIPLPQRLQVLELFQQNFHDSFNARALFDALANEASVKHDETSLKELRRIARDTTRKQIGLVLAAGESEHIIVELKSPQKTGIFKWFESFSLQENQTAEVALGSDQSDEEPHRLVLKLINVVSDAAAFVSLELNVHGVDPGRFEVSYYDTPFTDNIMLPDGHRLAIVLRDVVWRDHPHSATFQVIEFPANYIVTGYKPSIEQLNSLIGGSEHR